jgi:hypothetical protein
MNRGGKAPKPKVQSFFLMVPPSWHCKVIFPDFLGGYTEEIILADFVKKCHIFSALPQRCSSRIKTYVPILNKDIDEITID